MTPYDHAINELEARLSRIAEHEREARIRRDDWSAQLWAERYDEVEIELDNLVLAREAA